jgi:hypothetical protein
VSEQLLNARQVAELWGVSPSTVLDRFEAGEIPGFRLWGRKGGPVRFRPSELDASLERWHVGPGTGGDVRPTPPNARPSRVASHVRPTEVGGDEDG